MSRQRVGDIELYYEVAGQGDPLLLIHGLGSSTRDWEAQKAFFAPTYQVVVFDVRGHGQSDKPPGPYTMTQFAVDTAGLLDSLNVGPTHVVGISMGGMIAFQLVVTRPDLCRSLVIVNSGPELLIRSFSDRLRLWQRFLIVRLLGMRKMGEVLSQRLFPKPEHAPVRETFVRRWAENDPRAYLDAMRALVGWSVSDQLDKIVCPSLIVASDNDYTPLALKEAYIGRMPDARLAIMDDSRHAVPLERPAEFSTLLAEFLREV
jgi:3-oxoadipate enol-lactonase